MNGGILRGILLVIAMLALGGIIAFVGDRVGTKAGKARLRLGKLRPRQTATLVTIAMGTLTAAIVTGILLTTSKSLRQGIFRIREIRQERDFAEIELENIKSDLVAAQTSLDGAEASLRDAETSKALIQQELDEAEGAKDKAEQELADLRKNLKAEEVQAEALEAKIKALQSKIDRLAEESDALAAEGDRLEGEIAERDREIASRQEEIKLQDAELRDRTTRLRKQEELSETLTDQIQEQEEEIAALGIEREQLGQEVQGLEDRLAQSEQQLARRDRELAQSEQNLNRLRDEGAALEKGEAIESLVVQVGSTLSAQQAVDLVLSAANKKAFKRLFPGLNEEDEKPVIAISEDEVGRLRADISDGERYIIGVFSADTYLRYDPQARVVIARIPDEEVFGLGDVVATVRVTQNRSQFRASLTEHMEILNESMLQEAERKGVLVRKIFYDDADNLDTFLSFVERLKQLKGPVDSIEAVAREQISISGPLKVELVASYQGQVVLSSNNNLPSVENVSSVEVPIDESALNQ